MKLSAENNRECNGVMRSSRFRLGPSFIAMILTLLSCAYFLCGIFRSTSPAGYTAGYGGSPYQRRKLKSLSLDLCQTYHKKVLITGHARSGTGLVGAFFTTWDWGYLSEPLKWNWPHLDVIERDLLKILLLSVSSPADIRCRGNTPQHCTASKMVELADALNCQSTVLPKELLKYESRRSDIYEVTADGSPVDFDDHSTQQVLRVIMESDLLDEEGTFDVTCAPRPFCENKRGVAVRETNLVGRLNELYDVLDLLDRPVDLLIHLVRDPRALLASRISIELNAPSNRTYESTLSWATSICSNVMRDHRAGRKRPGYMLLRYEDMAASIEAAASAVWLRLGEEVPTSVQVLMRLKDGCINGTERQIAECQQMLQQSKDSATPYNTQPRDFSVQLSKWRDVLTEEEVRAVEDGCTDVYSNIYPDSFDESSPWRL